MSNTGLSATFGTTGFLLGWLTRPLVEARSSSLSLQELAAELLGKQDPLLADAALRTFIHLGLFGFSCVILGFVVARHLNGGFK